MRLKVGDTVCITFLDHCSRPGLDGRGPMLFEVYGKLVEVEEEYYTVASWVAPDLIVDQNTETYVILKSTVKGTRRLK